MRRIFLWLLAGILVAGLTAEAQMRGGAGCCGPAVGVPPVELKGKVSRVQISPGQGMPSVTIKDSDTETTVYLGSMRYLMAEDFNPKVGDSIVVKAYKMANGLFAATVTLPASNKTIRLRDEFGRPMWRGGRWR